MRRKAAIVLTLLATPSSQKRRLGTSFATTSSRQCRYTLRMPKFALVRCNCTTSRTNLSQSKRHEVTEERLERLGYKTIQQKGSHTRHCSLRGRSAVHNHSCRKA